MTDLPHIDWGRDSFPTRVVGTSHFQAALRAICGCPTEEGHDSEHDALLKREPDNPHDPNAVAVVIEDCLVGYLDRSQARRLARQMDEREIGRATCRARIEGGWDRGPEDRGHYGVRLAVARFGPVFED